MIQFKNFSLRRGTKLLFDDVSLIINPGEHIGLIGSNGAGKSSFFSILQGETIFDKGSCEIPKNWKISCFTQEINALDQQAIEYVLDGDQRLRKIEEKIKNNSGAALADAFAEYGDINGYTARSRAEIILLGLGFSKNKINQPVTNFSGGWRVRLNLARTLLCPSDLLLLDEPTNHLDIDAIIWLENWLSQFSRTCIVISHDREFLDKATDTTLFITNQKIHRYGSSYSGFQKTRATQLILQKKLHKKQETQQQHLETFINRFKAKATKAKQAQSRIKALAKMEKIIPLLQESSFNFEFSLPEKTPNPLIVLDQVDCGYQTNQPIIKKTVLSLTPGSRIGLLGPNGQGKTTLIKTIAGILPPLNGSLIQSKGVKIGYFAQHQVEILSPEDTPLSIMMKHNHLETEQSLRDFLGKLNFEKQAALTPIKLLSGGEKARLALAIIIFQKPNLLLLDEPTNHLDLQTRDALTLALIQFEGTLILISHDRYLLRSTTDVFLHVEDKELKEFDGDLDDYRKNLLEKSKTHQGEAENFSKCQAKNNLSIKKTDHRKKFKELERNLATLEKNLEKLASSRKINEIFIGNPVHYNPQYIEELRNRNNQLTLVIEEQNKLEELWLKLSEELNSYNK